MWILLVFSVAKALAQAQGPTVTIPDGKILGAVNFTVNTNITFYSFRGIPYAKPPIGDLRFKAPVPIDPWNGTFDATFERDVCPQMTSLVALLNSKVLGAEDCLHINVYTTNVRASLPVMLWIHGGAFQIGSNSIGIFPPDHFLEKGVIMVAINYRLGILGFLSTGDVNASGNWGLKDQVLALKWVKNNIKYFGGDPNKITIFGESAGAASVSYLVQSRETQGLFNSAIMQSGSSLCQWGLSRNPKEMAWRVGMRLLDISFSSKGLVDSLREANYITLKQAEHNVTIESSLMENLLAGLPWGPVQEPDIKGAFLTKNGKNWEVYSRGDFQKVPMIMGFNSNEAGAVTNYLLFLSPLLATYYLIGERFSPIDLSGNFLLRYIIGAIVKDYYFGILPVGIVGNNVSTFINIDQFIRPAREQVTQASKYVNVYFYQFSYRGPSDESGVKHVEELKYLFNLNKSINPQDKLKRNQMVTMWTNFAKTGNPTPDPTSDKVLPNTIWTANDATTDASNNLLYLDINTNLKMSSNPFQNDWEFYQHLYETYGDGDYTTY